MRKVTGLALLVCGVCASPASAIGGPVSYGQGHVLASQIAYPVLVSDAAHPMPASYRDGVLQYFRDVAADSGSTTSPYSVMQQYYQRSQFGDFANENIAYDIRTSAPIEVPVPQDPKGFCVLNPPSPSCQDDTAIKQIVAQAQASVPAPGPGVGQFFFVMMPPGVNVCGNDNGSYTCTPGNFCGYHSHLNNSPVAYAMISYASTTTCSGGVKRHPSGDQALDAAINDISHEQIEGSADPGAGGGWCSGSCSTGEIGDLCYLTFGPDLGGTGDLAWNTVINGHHYELQEQWSNAAGACVPRLDWPIRAKYVGPATVPAGTTVTFDGSSSTDDRPLSEYRWTFGDESAPYAVAPTATGATVTHTYARAGTYEVRLVVGDGTPRTNATTRTIAVTPPTGSTGTTGPAGATPPTATTAPATTLPAPPTTSLGAPAVSGTSVTLTLSCRGASAQLCHDTALLASRERQRGAKVLGVSARKKRAQIKTKLITDASASYDTPAGQSRVITLKLNSSALKLLNRFKRLPATLALNGKPVNTLTFKATKKKSKKRKH